MLKVKREMGRGGNGGDGNGGDGDCVCCLAVMGDTNVGVWVQ